MDKGIPAGLHSITPHLTVRHAGQALEFYKEAFGATAGRVHYLPDGKTILHADLRIGDSLLMLNEEFPDMGAVSPQSSGGGAQSVFLTLYVEDADSVFQKAVAAGAVVTMPVADVFWGDRYGKLTDPFGFNWAIATQVRVVSDEELARAAQDAMSKMGQA